MKNLTLNDATQEAILPHLEGTERLLAMAASKVDGTERGANVVAMPDLGFANNVDRMHGGFYTGALYEWESDAPMVPVDATVNSCGVSLFRLKDEIDNLETFNANIARVIKDTKENCSYMWNFNNGNHFVTYGVIEGATGVADGPHLLMHSSAGEFKKQLGHGLYPTPGNWYANDVKTIEDQHTGRSLRYIDGTKAELFIKTAQSLEQFNAKRHRYFAERIVGKENIVDEVSNEQHYGMPTPNSVAIGCQWKRDQIQVLLTEPGKPIYLVDPTTGA